MYSIRSLEDVWVPIMAISAFELLSLTGAMAYLSFVSLCKKMPAPCVSPEATSRMILPPFSAMTVVGQISTSTA